MRFNFLKANLKTAALVASVLLLGAGMSVANAQVNLSAGPTTTVMPDGATVPMWGYSCGAAVTGAAATCAPLNPNAAGSWSPVVITVPTGQPLTINLTNNLTFGANNIPTSIMIVGQLGGGLGDVTQRTTTPSPDHSNSQTLTWPIADPTTKGTPPAQGPRVQSFSSEVAAGTTTALTWSNPRPGTYLLESGTHPSIQATMGLYGVLVVTTAPSGTTAGEAYPALGTAPAVTYNAEVPIVMGEIDPVQNNAVNAAVNTVGFSETEVWSGLPGGCGNPSSSNYHTCYPPVVNYTPLYYTMNGLAFSKTNASASLFPATAGTATTGIAGNVLVRLVNAGSKMHVPSIVGALTGTPTAVSGFSLIAEDGNPLPGTPRVQSEVFMAAGKTFDVMVNVPAAGANALPVYDRELSLSSNAVGHDSGMLAYIGVNGSGLPVTPAIAPAIAVADSYSSLVAGQSLTVGDPGKGVIANDTNVYGVQLLTPPASGTVTLNPDGTFTYVPTGTVTTDSFSYCANGTVSGSVCSSGLTATVTLGAASIESAAGIVVGNATFTSNLATFMQIASPGVLAVDKDTAGYPLTVNAASVNPGPGLTLTVDTAGGFNASVAAAGTYTFTYKAQNAQGTVSSAAATVTLIFPTPTNLAVTVLDGQDKTTAITDYRWIIEEDRTFYINPNCTANPPPAGCPTSASGIVPTFGTNFHTSYMPVVAQGCTGSISCESGQTLLGQPAVCDVGNGACRTTGTQETAVLPSAVHLDPTKRYYISILPGDGATPFETGNASSGHGMGGAPITFAQTAVTVYTQPTPLPTAKLSVYVFEDDFPLNGEQDAGGGLDVLAPNEPGLGHFNITIMDDAGGSGDATGQVNYDMFNQPLSNSLSGTIDPATGADACPISAEARIGVNDPNQTGITGTIVTCPKLEADGVTLSPLAGQAVIANMMPGRYGVIATPGADRIASGEEWLQTNTLDGQKAHDSFLKVGEAGYFQEYGPASYHVAIGFANPKIINGRLAGVCNGTDINITGSNCTNVVKGVVTDERMSRTPDERLYSSGDNSSFAFTQCYISIGDPDGEDFAFTKCAADGTFTIGGLPDGNWRITVFDQWNDMLVDGLSTPVRLAGGGTLDMGQIAINQWQADIYTTTFFDTNGNGVRDPDEKGLTFVPTNNRYRDGSFSNFNSTDLDGYAGFNEVFPLFNWYVVETDTTRYKNTGTHVVYDAGGPADGTCTSATAPCGSSNIGHFMANTAEPSAVALPTALRVPGAVYCSDADCSAENLLTNPNGGGPGGSTGRIDPPWVLTEAWQGFSGQNNFLEFGKKPFAPGENGGIRGHVVYASTRPFDDPTLLLQLSWEPMVPNVTINLYKEGTAADGITPTLALVDTTKTSSWDDWAQGFRSDGNPNMSCPGQSTTDLFYFTLYNQPDWLDAYNNGGTPVHTLPNNAQFKCFDGMHNWNQLQPAPYDGMYQFPSVTAVNPTTGKPTGTNCTICVANPAPATDWTHGNPMLPAGKYVVEMIMPPGYELVKEEDKNILIGDNYIAPVTVQFPGLGSGIYILPDQATVSTTLNGYNAQNSTTDLGRTTFPSHEGDTGTVEVFWPCVGEARIVPDYISLYPGSSEVAPFAGATRNLCDRKEVTLNEQMSDLAKFYVFTSTHVAAHFTGVITDDFTSEFDPFSPQFGEKFSPPNLPISIRDWTGTEISRVYTDQWGTYNGLTYSTWEVNPPNPTGYAPTMMVTCMNDPGTAANPDPLYNPQYSDFCYEIPFMPGQTQYMDTPVVPTSAFASAGYNNPDCAYPNLTPSIKEVDGDGVGPWVSAAGHTLTIAALGDQSVPNNAYSGPQATTAPYNQKFITRHYGFGSTQGTVTIGGVPATVSGWSDTSITVTVPTFPAANSTCKVQQQAIYGGSPALCGELVITAASGQQSIDTVTVTVGGKVPTHVTSTTPMTGTGPGSVQQAIDAAAPGDLIILDPGVHEEMLLMWKPVRLQGVGAASSVIDANTQPEGKMDPWRRQVNCLFGLALNGQPSTANTITNNPNPGTNPFDSTGDHSCGGWTGFNGGPNNPQVDRIPLEGILGWDTTVNGNLAQLLQEPTLMGAYEGAGITVLGKGVNIPAGSTNIFGSGSESSFPVGTTLLTSSNCATGTGGSNPYPSNFQCNPSSIDGLSIKDSSQGGGGVFVHAWGHNLQIANNRVVNNTGTLTGGITVGQGEAPDAYLLGDAGNADPGSCESTGVTGSELPFCFNLNVNLHNNDVTSNSSIGDELFSATPAGGGGVTMCIGADYYQFNYNWVCGNLSTGDGGGLVHLGFIKNGDIEHNTIVFNQSTNPTVPTNGGGLMVMGAPPDGLTATGLECGGTAADADCAPGLSDGTGPNLTVNANLFMGNAAESGSGGGIRLQGVNGTDVVAFPNRSAQWNSVNITNNIVANNVAGWDGAGISMQDALNVNIVNNTVVSNDTTASSGVLFNTLGAPIASSQGPTCTSNCGTASQPQPAGLVTMQHSAVLLSNLPASLNVVCPSGHYAGGSASNGTCKTFSYPLLANNVFWQNRAFYIGVGPLGSGTINQQNVVALYNAFTSTQAITQPTADASTSNGGGSIITGGTGACVSPASYWDIGVRGDTGPSDHSGGITLAPTYSVLTDVTDYSTASLHNIGSNPTVVSQYCNGSRTPPEFQSMGYQVPPGVSDATVPNPIFNLTPAATVDEGNNWINISWGPLAMTNPVTGSMLGNYSLAAGSPAIDYVPTGQTHPTTDFFGNPRPDPAVANRFDVGAIEFQGAGNPAPALTSITPNSGRRAGTVNVTLTGTDLTGTTAVTVSGAGITVSGVTVVNPTTVTATFTIASNAGLTARNVTVTTAGGTSNALTFTVTGATLTSISPTSGLRGTSVPVTFTGTGLTGATSVNVSGAGFTVTNFVVASDTQATATFVIAGNAGLTARNVTITTPAGNTGAVIFTVTAPAPATLTSISPNSGSRGAAVPVTLTGTNLTGTTAVVVSGTGITVSGITVVNATTVTANFTTTTGAGLTARTVHVTTGAGNSNNVTFTVTGPTLAAVSPATGTHNTTVPVTLTGTGLSGAAAITVSGGGVSCSITGTTATTISANCAITNGAAHTARSVRATTPIGNTNTLAGAFKVN